MNVFIKYHGKTVGPYGVGGFDRLNNQVSSDVKTLVLKAAQEDGSVPHNLAIADMEFMFEKKQTPIYANC